MKVEIPNLERALGKGYTTVPMMESSLKGSSLVVLDASGPNSAGVSYVVAERRRPSAVLARTVSVYFDIQPGDLIRRSTLMFPPESVDTITEFLMGDN